ncbi:MAG: FAD-dependent monooxygenase [Clostridiales bacterium]|nr:FAD-dependent monooxygenase [Clostridiales bacterium]
MPIGSSLNDLKLKVQKKLKIKSFKKFSVSKQSIDARDKKNIMYVYSVDVAFDNEGKYINNKDILKIEPYEYKLNKINSKVRPVIVGSGPAGLFAALILAESGAKPIILERGKPVDERKKDVDLFFETGVLNEESNVQFGEGGAGSFSDGKLTTGVNDFRAKKILDEFIFAGAPEEIGYLSKPHIGTDNLKLVIKNIRGKIIKLGGEFRFSNKLIDLEVEGNSLVALKVKSEGGEYYIEGDKAILALGHSARSTFYMLGGKGLTIARKSFSVGFRIEHLQKMIDKSQYGGFYKKLPPAEYKLNTHTSNGRGVYTFCMCPGGQVVAAASEKGGLVTNGMSYYGRDLENSNAALLVGINADEFKSNDVFEGVKFQIALEEKAFKLGGGDFKAPVQLLGDFLIGKASTSIGSVTPSYKPGFTLADLNSCFSGELLFAFKEAIYDLDKKLHGFNTYDAALTFAESRSSSPIRFIRGSNFESNIKGLYLAGEGAGYAGGIMSAAIDGIKASESMIQGLI